MSNQNLEGWLKESVEGLETTPSSQVWESLSAKLATQAAAAGSAAATTAAGGAGASSAGIGLLGWVAIATTVVATTAGIWYWSTPTEVQAEVPEVIEQVEPEAAQAEEPNTTVEAVVPTVENNADIEQVEAKQDHIIVKSTTQEVPSTVAQEREQDLVPAIASEPITKGSNDVQDAVFEENVANEVVSPTDAIPEPQPTTTEVQEDTPSPAKDQLGEYSEEEELRPGELTMPNIFTPGTSSFFNDRFEPLPNETDYIDSYRISIYDQTGNLVWKASEDNETWNGISANGDEAPSGWYIYSVSFVSLDGVEGRKDGRVMIQR